MKASHWGYMGYGIVKGILVATHCWRAESAHAKLEARITLRYVHRPSHINIYIYIYTQKNRPVDMTRRARSARQLFIIFPGTPNNERRK